CSLIPFRGVADKIFLFYSDAGPVQLSSLVCNFNSFVLDYCIRQKISGITLNYFIIKQLPVLAPKFFQEDVPWAKNVTILSWLASRALEMIYTAWDIEDYASDCGYSAPPFQWDSERRFLIRCEL